MTDVTSTVTTHLETLIRAVPGVEQLYRSSVLTDSLTQAAARIAPALQTDRPYVRIDEGVVSVSVAVADDTAAPQVAHDVHDVIAAHMTAAALPFVRADITIARIG